MEEEMEILREYFKEGYTYNVILDMLSTHHDINMSLRIRGVVLPEHRSGC